MVDGDGVSFVPLREIAKAAPAVFVSCLAFLPVATVREATEARPSLPWAFSEDVLRFEVLRFVCLFFV